MHSYLFWILALLIGVFFLDTLADLLNLDRLNDKLPGEFREIYDAKKYAESLRYQKDRVRFEFVQRTFFVGVTIPFIVLGGFQKLDEWSRSWGGSELSTGLLFIAFLGGGQFLLQLPFSIYDTFVLEARYGFNKTTWGVFLGDLCKGLLLGSILGGLIFSGVVYFFEVAGPEAWLYSWITFTVFQIALTYLAPILIMPLFNQFKPLPNSELKQAIEDYARTRQFQLNGIFTMDSSKRSTKSNAFFTGFGRFRRLVLFDTLVEKHSIQELVAVLAHEIGHFERKHIVKSMVLSILTTGVVFYTFKLFIYNQDLFAAFRMSHLSVYASVVFVGLIYSPIFRLLSVFTQVLSRKHEFEADQFAVETYGHPEKLISALKKMSVDHLSHLTPHPLKVALDYSHPPILKRIQVLERRIRGSR